MNGTVEVVGSVADRFAEVVSEVLARGTAGAAGDRGVSLFLSGGPTAQKAYERLAQVTGPGASAGGPVTTPTVDWTRVDAYWGDERCVPPDDEDSNQRLCREALLDPVGPLRSIHPMYTGGDPDAAAAAYQDELRGLDTFDVVHLGMGPDGHCASLFPGSAALDAPEDVLVLANTDPNATNPHQRITLTFPAIARARLVVFTVAGASKRDAFARVRKGEPLPAGRVQASEVLWLVDAEAAGDQTGT
ncbi:MAG TPA: 6-phosphogluconolactonase [Acidimicrobiales bacterium]|jgi:6-phosphogluconolactonase|nr:6-phosphogluconolactonase [Acidimicrobiales bacterium]